VQEYRHSDKATAKVGLTMVFRFTYNNWAIAFTARKTGEITSVSLSNIMDLPIRGF